jgi:diguanylate cyclase (GGDEF)-like protein/PAS domain S-box-containing protein
MTTVTRERAPFSAFATAFNEPDFFREVLDDLSEAVYLVDQRRTIRFWNRACEELTGYTAAEVVGHRCFEDILRHVDEHGKPLCVGLCPLSHTMRDGTPRRTRVWLHHKSGHRVPVQVGVNPVRDREGRIIGAIETFRDDSSLAATQERVGELEALAMVDPLTEIPNRRFLGLTLPGRLAELRRHGAPFIVAFADIDHFKQINDAHGHETGDAVLRMVATTLAANLRATDTVTRFGGDEFVLLLQYGQAEASDMICERMRALVAASSLDHPAGAVSVTMSFGATPARSSDSLSSVLTRADALLYASKWAGRNRITTVLPDGPA